MDGHPGPAHQPGRGGEAAGAGGGAEAADRGPGRGPRRHGPGHPKGAGGAEGAQPAHGELPAAGALRRGEDGAVPGAGGGHVRPGGGADPHRHVGVRGVPRRQPAGGVPAGLCGPRGRGAADGTDPAEALRGGPF